MKFYQQWEGVRLGVDGSVERFPATVPGNIQKDYGEYKGFGDVMYSTNCEKFKSFENDRWEYRSILSYDKKSDQRAWFVSKGIDYKYDILLNGNNIYSYEGMFAPVEIDLTDMLSGGDELCIRIAPHPKRDGAPSDTRDEADNSCKPPVCYGWDWNPRLLISGMWQEAYIEIRDNSYIGDCEARYKLSQDFSSAEVNLSFKCEKICTVSFYDAEGNLLYNGEDTSFKVNQPKLWWCNGEGEPYLYRWVVENDGYTVSGKIGFKSVKLVRNTGAGDPKGFPMSRYDVPFTLELNGRKVFMKGSNFVNADIFWGDTTKERYSELIDLALEANMNIFRMGGGASFAKESFYELCDEKGMLIWQEFMLACNKYPNDEHYLSVLKNEAEAMIKLLRSHACMAMWCGGNELFNTWSGMDDQSYPLRLLNALCYEHDMEHPFLMTSPLNGMAHGGYRFYDEQAGGDVYQSFQNANMIAYTEFGVPSMAPMELLEKIIPENELGMVTPTDAWITHHALKAWKPDSHSCISVIEKYFGQVNSTQQIVEFSNWLQCEGYKAIFEESRRQWPHCSAAVNWCFNEPWITAANCNIVSFPAVRKDGFYAVKEALRPTLFSARIPKFDWKAGEKFKAEIWLLNDSNEDICADTEVFLEVGGVEYPLLTWKNAKATKKNNCEGAQICMTLPSAEADRMTLILRSDKGYDSKYTLRYINPQKKAELRTMNIASE